MTTGNSEFSNVLGDDRIAFYRSCIDVLNAAGIEMLVGGAYALRYYTGIARDTKDLDLFIRPGDVDDALAALAAHGYKTEKTSPVWLAKVFHGAAFVDLIFRSGNGAAQVDDHWFDAAESMRLFDRAVDVVPVEEVIWSKAFTMERERFDLADIVHLIQARGSSLNWQHLLSRFGPHWRVLFSHIILFQYAFPNEGRLVPYDIIVDLTTRLLDELLQPPESGRICRGTLLSGTQYLVDTIFRGYDDARFDPINTGMSAAEIAGWKEKLAQEQAARLQDAALIPPPVKHQTRTTNPRLSNADRSAANA